MPEMTNINDLSKGVGTLARDAAYVAVGLGVLGYQRAQVHRVELQNRLSEDFSFDERLNVLRDEVARGVKQLDELVEQAVQFLESSIHPFEDQLPPTVTQVTTKAFGQAREVRSQIRQRVVPA
ncbi:MAG: hypothetical protein ACLPVF_08490 [Acidimicrobiales bacterium]